MCGINHNILTEFFTCWNNGFPERDQTLEQVLNNQEEFKPFYSNMLKRNDTEEMSYYDLALIFLDYTKYIHDRDLRIEDVYNYDLEFQNAFAQILHEKKIKTKK